MFILSIPEIRDLPGSAQVDQTKPGLDRPGYVLIPMNGIITCHFVPSCIQNFANKHGCVKKMHETWSSVTFLGHKSRQRVGAVSVKHRTSVQNNLILFIYTFRWLWNLNFWFSFKDCKGCGKVPSKENVMHSLQK